MINFKTRLKNSFNLPGIFENNGLLFRISMIIVFLVAGAIRLYHIQEPGILIDREYTSAILARSFYFDKTESISDWQREVSAIARQNQPILEPPITEYFVSLIYRVVGSEQLWISHLLTSIFWLVGGIYFYKLAKIVISINVAVIATLFYLFAPLSVLISRSFQPDSLMMMLFLISLYAILMHNEQPTMFRLLMAGGLTGFGLLYRPIILFVLLGAFISLAIYRKKSWKFIFEKDFIIFIIISLLPVFLYYGYGILFAGFLKWKVTTSFRPNLYLHREYWEGWLNLAVNGIGYPILLGALLGIPTLRRGVPRYLILGLWFGYIIFGLIFTMHIHTHDYYQAQLIPIAALSFGSLVMLILDQIRQLNNKWYWWIPVAAPILIFMFFSIQNLRTKIGSQIYESEQLAQDVGEIVNHNGNVVFVSRYYSLPIQYYGEMAGMPWLKAIETPLYRLPGERELSIDERIKNYNFVPEYYVITDFNEFNNRHGDLKAYLNSNCSLVAESNEYLIYNGNCTQ